MLNLGNESLTKEIRLTQDLLDLFIQYQIPSDLLSFGGPSNVSDAGRLQAVKDGVKGIFDMIENAKRKEIEEARKEAEAKALEEMSRNRIREESRERAAPQARMFSMMSSGPGAMMKSAAPAPSRPIASMPIASMPSPTPHLQQGPPQQQQQQQSQSQSQSKEVAKEVAKVEEPKKPEKGFDSGSESDALDYTKIPTILDAQFEKLDEDSALRPTILNVGKVWTKKSQKALLAEPSTQALNKDKQKIEKNTCYDLLDGLTKSGCLAINDASLHIVIASTHCFAKNLMNTLVQDNVNPIEKLERSNLIVASTIHSKKPEEMLKESEVKRVQTVTPNLFLK